MHTATSRQTEEKRNAGGPVRMRTGPRTQLQIYCRPGCTATWQQQTAARAGQPILLIANRLAFLLRNTGIVIGPSYHPSPADAVARRIRRNALEATLDRRTGPKKKQDTGKKSFILSLSRKSWVWLVAIGPGRSTDNGSEGATFRYSFNYGTGSGVEEGNGRRYYPVPICCLI